MAALATNARGLEVDQDDGAYVATPVRVIAPVPQPQQVLDNESGRYVDDGLPGHKQLGCASWLFLGILFGFWIVSFVAYVEYACLYPLFFVPWVFLYRYWSRSRESLSLDTVVIRLAYGFILMALVVTLTQVFVVGMIMVGLASTGLLRSMVGTSVFFLTAAFLYVFCEEWAKVKFARVKKWYMRPGEMTRKHLVAATSTSVGFATCQGLMLLLNITWATKADDLGPEFDKDTFLVILLTGLGLSLLNTPLHIMTGYLIGLKVTKAALDNESRVEGTCCGMTGRCQEGTCCANHNADFKLIQVPWLVRGIYLYACG